jgi:hypothetical protein
MCQCALSSQSTTILRSRNHCTSFINRKTMRVKHKLPHISTAMDWVRHLCGGPHPHLIFVLLVLLYWLLHTAVPQEHHTAKERRGTRRRLAHSRRKISMAAASIGDQVISSWHDDDDHTIHSTRHKKVLTINSLVNHIDPQHGEQLMAHRRVIGPTSHPSLV